jgi:CheY-like chemotaxis protein
MTPLCSKSVLVVDDEPGMRMALQANFQRDGWAVVPFRYHLPEYAIGLEAERVCRRWRAGGLRLMGLRRRRAFRRDEPCRRDGQCCDR